MTALALNENPRMDIDADEIEGLEDTSENGYGNYGGQGSFGRHDGGVDRNNLAPMEVAVDHSLDKAMRVLKRKLIREGILKELKARRYFEKPCERKKRKGKESVKKRRKEEARMKKFVNQLIG